VTSSAVVGSSAMSSAGSLSEGHGDHHALPHAAGELVRVVVEAPVGVGDAHAVEHQRERGQVATVELDPAGEDFSVRVGEEPHDGEGGDAFAASGLADQAEGAAGGQGEVDAVDGDDRAGLGVEADAEALDVEERGVGHGGISGT
jgi:hypothetical protein